MFSNSLYVKTKNTSSLWVSIKHENKQNGLLSLESFKKCHYPKRDQNRLGEGESELQSLKQLKV